MPMLPAPLIGVGPIHCAGTYVAKPVCSCSGSGSNQAREALLCKRYLVISMHDSRAHNWQAALFEPASHDGDVQDCRR